MPLRDATGWGFYKAALREAVSEEIKTCRANRVQYVPFPLVWQLSDPSDLPKNAFSIFLLLVEHLCVEHIDYALEIGLSGTCDGAVFTLSYHVFWLILSPTHWIWWQEAQTTSEPGFWSQSQTIFRTLLHLPLVFAWLEKHVKTRWKQPQSIISYFFLFLFPCYLFMKNHTNRSYLIAGHE